MMMMRLLVFLLFFMAARFHFICSYTHPEDLAILQALKADWQSKPPTWTQSNDPCGSNWEGVTCNNDSRVTAIGLPSMGIVGKLPSDIGGLSQLISLDLSFNTDLTGSIPTQLGNLENLQTLILAGCGLTGSIPDALGNLTQLTFLALNSNKLTGNIPASLGKLSNLYWLDVANNELTGSLPVSTDTSPGLDMLLAAKHFHFNMNNLSGPIPESLFSSAMKLIHVLFDGNQLTGPIPSTLALVQDLQALRIDRNKLTGEIPSNINNLTNLNELNLANNGLNGSIPDLSNMNVLNYVDLSNNTFNASEAPEWFSSLPALNTLVLENGSLQGVIPSAVFSSSLIQQLLLKNNAFSGTLNISIVGPDLQYIDLENNQIGSLTLGSPYNEVLMLYGNPVCTNNANNLGAFCQVQQTANTEPYKTSTSQCGAKTCSGFKKISPANCECQVPYQGTLNFRAPFFRDLTDATLFNQLGDFLSSNLSLPYNSAYLENPFFDSADYMQIKLSLFPPSGTYFSHSDISRIGTLLSNNIFKPPALFGPYFFIGFAYPFAANNGVFLSTGAIVGISVSATVLLLGLVALAVYAIRQKKRAEHAVELSKSFASWGGGGKDIAGAPQLKGARWFSFDEVKKCTNNFSEHNEIGAGGYGKVYRGILSDGQVVAIKRAQQGSMQGGQEFRTEIELLSRVHHKNLVSLVGFCFEQGEQMLVYEFISNGTLRENLTGRSGKHLDWKTRLQITLGSARGLAYLHELANPPIIHRDIKTMNILLDENLTAKVADFGLSKLVSGPEAHVSTQVKGTLGYLDPEYYMTQQLTEKSDVYSFGVVMLELITSRLPIEKGKYIVREVRMALDKNDEQYCGLKEMIDPSLTKNGGYLFGFSKFLELALQSVQESAVDRPSMNDIVKEIEFMLHEDDVHNADMISAASSATDFGSSNQHPYDDVLAKRVAAGFNSNSFDYSGGYNLSTKIEPK